MYDCIIYVYTYTGKYNHISNTHITQYSIHVHLIICQFLLEERTVALPASVFNREIFRRAFADRYGMNTPPHVHVCTHKHNTHSHRHRQTDTCTVYMYVCKCVCMYVSVRVRMCIMFVYMYVYVVGVNICLCVCAYMCLCMCVYIYVYLCTCVCTYVYMYVCISVCVCVCVCVDDCRYVVCMYFSSVYPVGDDRVVLYTLQWEH